MIFKILLTIIPLILFVLLTNYDVSAQEIDLECPKNEGVVVRTTNPNPICVDQITAQRWAELGITEIVGELAEEKAIEASVIAQKEKNEKEGPIVTSPSFDESNTAQSYIVRIFGGEFESPLIFKTFSRVEPGDTPHYIKSFHDLGLTSYFVLGSLPSKDKSEFYKLMADYLSPGKEPELFNTSIDVLTGDGFILATANYSDCKITGYIPFTQEFVLFYQYSGEPDTEIRDLTTIYCGGLDVEVYDSEQNVSDYEPVIPTK